MLTLSEEIFLLALDDRKGSLKPLPSSALEFALAGGLLLDLSLAGRIDTDLTHLFTVDDRPLGDPLLDTALAEIKQAGPNHSINDWLCRFSEKAKSIQDGVLSRLIGKGVLRQENRKILWVLNVRRYPAIDNHEIKEVTARLRELILSDDIPDAREAVLISLAFPSHLLDDLFTAAEMQKVLPRLKGLAKLDLIGQEVSKIIHEISQAMAMAMMP